MKSDIPPTEAEDSAVSTRRFMGNTFSVGLSTGSKAVAYFLVSLAVTRVLGVGALGVFTVALTTAILALRVADLGVGTIIVRDTAVEPRRGPELLGSGVIVRAAGLLLMVVSIAVIGFAIGYRGDDLAVMWLLGAYAAFESLSRLVFANSHGRMRMDEEAWVAFPTALILIAVPIALLVNGGGLVAVGAAFAGIGALQFVAAAVLASMRAPGWHRSGRWVTARSILRQGWPIGLAGLAAVVYYRIDTLMLAAFAGDIPAGEYSMAYNLLYGPNLLIWALMASAFPLLARGEKDPDRRRLRSRFRKLTAAAASAGALFLLFIPFAALLLEVLYGTAPPNASSSLRILLVAQVFTFFAATTGTTFNATGRQRINLGIVLIGVVLNVGLNLLVIPRFGAPGAASTTVATEAFVAVTGLVILFGSGLRPFFAPAGRHAGAAR